MFSLPKIVYFQTITVCNGHCVYCPFDDIYNDGENYARMSDKMFAEIILQLENWKYKGRIGFLLHYEPSLEPRLPNMIKYIRKHLPEVTIEVATNGLINQELLQTADVIDIISPGTQTFCTSRAGNARACIENSIRETFPQPCTVPIDTMCIAANGNVLLCCQDWRHESVVGQWNDLDSARNRQITYAQNLMNLEICKDCAAGLTSEEVGNRLGKRHLN